MNNFILTFLILTLQSPWPCLLPPEHWFSTPVHLNHHSAHYVCLTYFMNLIYISGSQKNWSFCGKLLFYSNRNKWPHRRPSDSLSVPEELRSREERCRPSCACWARSCQWVDLRLWRAAMWPGAVRSKPQQTSFQNTRKPASAGAGKAEMNFIRFITQTLLWLQVFHGSKPHDWDKSNNVSRGLRD